MLFLEKKLDKKVNSVIALLKQNQVKLGEKLSGNLVQLEGDFIKKLSFKNPNLIFDFRKFLRAKKVVNIKRIEATENSDAMDVYDKLIEEL